MNDNKSILQLYDPDKKYQQENSNVIMSHGFIRSGETESIRQIYKCLKEDYNVYLFDNAGHGSNNHVSFDIEQQRKILKTVLSDPILEKKSNHLLLSCMPALFSSYVFAEQKELLSNIKTLSIYAPVINIYNGINRNFKNRKISKSLGNILLSTGLLNLYLLHGKKVRVNAKLMRALHHNLTPDKNIDILNILGKEIPLHLLFNTNDDVNDRVSEKLNNNIDLTHKYTDRHHIYFQKEADYTTLKDIDLTQKSMGDMVREFMKKFD